jgi:hypothetical protein
MMAKEKKDVFKVASTLIEFVLCNMSFIFNFVLLGQDSRSLDKKY